MRKASILKAVMVLLLIITPNIYSQTFSVTGASSTFYNTGTIILSNDNGQFQTDNNSVGNIDNSSGTIQFDGTGTEFTDETGDPAGAGALGVSDANRITGLTRYSHTGAVNQTVQSRYYSNLNMGSAANKQFPTVVWVSNSYTVDAGSGSRDYATNSNNFIYDGTSTNSTTQTILGESAAGGTNGYYNLTFDGDALKVILNGTTARSSNSISVNAGTSGQGITIQGILQADTDFNQAAGAGQIFVDGSVGTASLSFGSNLASIGSNVNMISGTGAAQVFTGTGGAQVEDGADVTVTSGTFFVNDGDLILAAGNSKSFTLVNDPTNNAIIVASGRTFTVNGGGFVNQAVVGTRTNMDFADGSAVVYNDGGQVVGTDVSNPYDDIFVTGTAVGAESTTININGDVNVYDNNFDVASSSATVHMLNSAANANYGSGIEIAGVMSRDLDGTTATYTFNNEATTVDIDAGSANVSQVALDVRPATNNSDYDAVRDVNRTINFYYTSSDTFTANILYAYQDGTVGADENPTGGADYENTLRGREDLGGTNTEKIATGTAVERNNTTSPFKTVYIQDIRRNGDTGGPTVFAQVANGGLVFLRGGPTTFISINDGRWSNPGTWDEGEQPGPEDIAVIRDNVHIGYERSVDGFTTDEDVHISGFTNYTDKSTIAAEIIIDEDYVGNTDDQATLLIGGNSNVGINENTAFPALIPNAGSISVEPNGSAAVEGFDVTETDGLSTGNTIYNAGLVVFAGSTFLIRNDITIDNNFLYNGGTIRVDN